MNVRGICQVPYGIHNAPVVKNSLRGSTHIAAPQSKSARPAWWRSFSSPHHRTLSTYPPHVLFHMPALSPTMEAGSIAKWNVEVGESFAAGDSLCEVETDKATVDFESQDDGTIAKILVEAGPGDIPCGDPIMILVEDAADADAFKDYTVVPATEAAAPPPEASAAAVVAPVSAPATTTPTPPTTTTTTTSGRAVASPLAHMLAKDLGYDISLVTGTGPGGRIIAADVKEFVPATETVSTLPTTTTTTSTTPPPVAGVGYTDYPLSVTAQEVAARLAASKTNVPHYYLSVDLRLDALLALRSSLNKAVNPGQEEDSTTASISLHDLLIKAAACAMKAVPTANASWMGSVVRVYDEVDMNVAVGNGDTLYTPLLKNVTSRGVKSISDDLTAWVKAAASPEGLAAESCGMGTFTVINLGTYGIKSCAPIITEPQACALALGAAEHRIIPHDDPDSDEIYQEAVMLTATMSLDHRVVDGAVGAQWLSAFKKHVENPEILLL